jgi:hypothetical protein
MTVAITVKVFDGIVLAADSATTLDLASGDHQVYNNADKIFQLHRTLPIGAMTWGRGSIGAASIATLAKDLRRRFMGKEPLLPGWELDPDTYTMQTVVDRLIEMMFDELYQPQGLSGALGFVIAGYSAGSKDPEAWKVLIEDAATRPTPQMEAATDVTGWFAYAQSDPVARLFNGIDGPTAAALLAAAPANTADLVNTIVDARVQPVHAAMPFADAIKLAEFMVDVTVKFRRFSLGADTVGGPIEVAGISRHEGFKWISRKHYYDPVLNPQEPHP